MEIIFNKRATKEQKISLVHTINSAFRSQMISVISKLNKNENSLIFINELRDDEKSTVLKLVQRQNEIIDEIKEYKQVA